jgi:hypothetical protein
MASTPGGTGSPDAGAARKSFRWLVAVGVALLVGLFVLLVRYAIDILALLSILILINRWTRDMLADWAAGERFEDEPDPVWALGAVGMGVFGTLLTLLWLAGTTHWAGQSRFSHLVPPAFTRVAVLAEEYGWGQRVVLPGGPTRRTTVPISPRAAASSARPLESDRSESMGSTQTAVASSGGGRQTASGTAGTAEAATPRVRTGRPGAKLTATSTTLASSHSPARVSTRVRFTARVTAARLNPRGTVVFRCGSTTLGTVSVNRDGTAALNVSDLAVGSNIITAEFTGNAAFGPSRSLPVIQTILP